MNRELHRAWQRVRDDDDAFVLVITGVGFAKAVELIITGRRVGVREAERRGMEAEMSRTMLGCRWDPKISWQVSR